MGGGICLGMRCFLLMELALLDVLRGHTTF
jgi:hypothetical protein